MRDRTAWACLAIAAILVLAGCSEGTNDEAVDEVGEEAAAFICEPTRPPVDADGLYGDAPLQVILMEGTYQATAYEGGHRIKIGWQRHVAGDLEVTARRLDGPGSATTDMHEEAYPETGVLPTSIVFSDLGCWEVTGTLGEATTTVVLDLGPPAS